MERLRAWATGHPVDLAVFRITVSAVVLLSLDVWDAPKWAGAVGLAPVGWRTVASVLPASTASAFVALGLVVVFTSLTLIGAWTRVSSVIAAVSLVWLLGVPQQSGLVLHTHHLAWFLALVASGPSGDVVSFDAWRARRRGAPIPGPSLAHGLPVRAAWLSIGLIFFFPGLWKLVGGAPWLEGLPTLIAWKRFQLGLPRLELPPMLIRAGGVGAIVFELSVGALLVFRRTRIVGVVAALAFHAGVQWVMGIAFSSLWSCYLVFVPWSRWFGNAPSAVSSAPSPRPAIILASLLLGAQVTTGVLGLESAWPVACYPTFRTRAPEQMRWVELETSEGIVVSVDRLRQGPNQRWWGLSEQAAWDPSRERLQGLFAMLIGRPPREGETIRWTRVTVDLRSGATSRDPL